MLRQQHDPRRFGGTERDHSPAVEPRGLTAFQRANELVLRVSCVAEAYAGGIASVSYQQTAHALPHAVYETILRDEAHH